MAASASALSPAPARIVHFGVGAFTRAHQSWYTSHATDSAEWGITGFTGRSSDMAELLSAQDGLYTLIQRDRDHDDFEIISNLLEVHPGHRLDIAVAALANPATSLVTLTLTEAAYRIKEEKPGGDLKAYLLRDLEQARSGFAGLPSGDVSISNVLVRLLLGLEWRRRAGLPAPALVPCDNLPDNGGVLRRALTTLSRSMSPSLTEWLEQEVSFVSSSVDRITPRTTPDDRADVERQTGWIDLAPVVTEPFSDWVLSGSFPLGRPDWVSAGATFVDDIEPWEARKLWLLNGAHTLLASLGQLRGHATVASAIYDVVCRASVEALWDDAARHLPVALNVPLYRAALLRRFENPRVAHLLEQIAADSLTKVRVRIVPVARLELAAGGEATGSAAALAAWIVAVRLGKVPLDSEEVADKSRSAESLLASAAPDLVDLRHFRRAVLQMANDLERDQRLSSYVHH